MNDSHFVTRLRRAAFELRHVEIGGCEFTPAECVEVARRLESVPELLYRLQECIDCIDRLDARLLNGSPKESERGEITRARAAIARATGGQA